MEQLTTNEWIDATLHKPWPGREVFVYLSNGTKVNLKWNGVYWVDPITNIKQNFYPDGLHPEYFFIYEKLKKQ